MAIRSSKKENKIEAFWKELEEKLEMCAGIELDRFEIQAKKKFASFPFLMQQGLYYTSDNKPHKADDEIREVIKQGSLSIGYIGISEVCKVLLDKILRTR